MTRPDKKPSDEWTVCQMCFSKPIADVEFAGALIGRLCDTCATELEDILSSRRGPLIRDLIIKLDEVIYT